jgi:hypothetical protein
VVFCSRAGLRPDGTFTTGGGTETPRTGIGFGCLNAGCRTGLTTTAVFETGFGFTLGAIRGMFFGLGTIFGLAALAPDGAVLTPGSTVFPAGLVWGGGGSAGRD